MALVSIAKELKRARVGRYALALFDTVDMHATEGMIAALEERDTPGMVAMYAGLLDRDNARAFAKYIRARAEDVTVPISLMLDHGRTLDDCRKAMELEFTDIMYDGSSLPFAENLANTREIVDEAHALGIAVEAELGHVGSGREYQSYGARREGFTDPDAVGEFVAETGVDFLAVAVGTAHGQYDGEPIVDLELLAEIRERVDIPLVLHGGSGLSEKQYRDAIGAGIAKINIATDLFVAAGEAVGEAEGSYHAVMGAARESFEERCGWFVDVFAGR